MNPTPSIQGELFIGREMNPNSVMIYREKILPTLSGRKLQVLNAIKELGGSATLYEVAKHLNIGVNCISGRFTELKRVELIEDTKQLKKHGESTFTIWKIKE